MTGSKLLRWDYYVGMLCAITPRHISRGRARVDSRDHGLFSNVVLGEKSEGPHFTGST